MVGTNGIKSDSHDAWGKSLSLRCCREKIIPKDVWFLSTFWTYF